MATSGVSTGLDTAGDIVRAAYELRGAVSIEGDVTGSQMDTGLKRMNWMLKGWPRSLWRIQDVTINWPADTPEAELENNYLDIENVRYEDGQYLERMSRDQAASDIYNRTTEGNPSTYITWRERNKLWLRLWPVPTAATTLRVDVHPVVEDVTSPDEHVDIQQEWTETVVYNLATRLVGGDPKLIPLVEMRAADLYKKLGQFDQGGSMFLQPALY